MPEAACRARVGPRRFVRQALPRRESHSLQALPGQSSHRSEHRERHDDRSGHERAGPLHGARVAGGPIAGGRLHRSAGGRSARPIAARGRVSPRFRDRRARVRARARRRSSRSQPRQPVSRADPGRHQAEDPRLRRRKDHGGRRDRDGADGTDRRQHADVRAGLRGARAVRRSAGGHRPVDGCVRGRSGGARGPGGSHRHGWRASRRVRRQGARRDAPPDAPDVWRGGGRRDREAARLCAVPGSPPPPERRGGALGHAQACDSGRCPVGAPSARGPARGRRGARDASHGRASSGANQRLRRGGRAKRRSRPDSPARRHPADGSRYPTRAAIGERVPRRDTRSTSHLRGAAAAGDGRPEKFESAGDRGPPGRVADRRVGPSSFSTAIRCLVGGGVHRRHGGSGGRGRVRRARLERGDGHSRGTPVVLSTRVGELDTDPNQP